MSRLIVIVLVLAVATPALSISKAKPFPSPLPSELTNDPDWAAFKQFVVEFERRYDTTNEVAARFVIFKANVARAAAMQKGDQHAQWGVTQFMDLSPQEFRERFLMSNFTSPKIRGEHVPILPSALPFQNMGSSRHTRNASVPPDFDWNSRGVISGVYNQGSCASCWAFSTTENVESMWAIKGHGLPNLSMQQLVDCDSWSSGCGGGNPPNAFQYLIDVGGQDSYGSYPYAGVNQGCRFNRGNIAARLTGWGYISTNDNENGMLNWIGSYGPPSACVCASQWQYYQGGVVTTQSGCCTQIDHCIQITGWGVANGIESWIIRNSWGNWGPYGGYIYLQIGYDICGIGQEVQACSVA